MSNDPVTVAPHIYKPLIENGSGSDAVVNMNQMAESDARALYRYLVSLGGGGEAMPTTLPPGVEPTTLYILLEPVVP